MKIVNALRWACLGMCLGALAAGAEGKEPSKQELLDGLERMNERIGEVESRLDSSESELQATKDELDASQGRVARQESLLEKVSLARESKSGIASFYEQVEISGWVASSYFWNFNDPEDETIGNQSLGGTNQGINGGIIPFHPDHNSFSVDQLWLEIEKPVSEESRGGFRADLVWGKTASILGQPVNRSCGFADSTDPTTECGGDSASDFYLYQAYAQYLTPWGQTLKMGKFGTLIGYEVAATAYNFNITRGNVYNLTQPITHYGLLMEGATEGGFLYALGVLNSDSAIDPDTNNEKTVLGRLGYAGETWSAIANVIWGPEGFGSSGGKAGRFNVIADWNPTEKFSSWVDFTYAWDQDSAFSTASGNADIWGIAVAGRYGFTDRLGFAVRGEYVEDNNNFAGFTSFMGTAATGDDVPVDIQVWSLTGTLDYLLTENLTTKFEVRWDHMDHSFGSADEFVNSRREVDAFAPAAFTNANQVVAGVEVIYQF